MGDHGGAAPPRPTARQGGGAPSCLPSLLGASATRLASLRRLPQPPEQEQEDAWSVASSNNSTVERARRLMQLKEMDFRDPKNRSRWVRAVAVAIIYPVVLLPGSHRGANRHLTRNTQTCLNNVVRLLCM